MTAHNAHLTLSGFHWPDEERLPGQNVVERLLLPWERLKYSLIPGGLYAWFRARRQRRRGEPELRHLGRLVDGDRNAVDVGANKGIYAWHLARICRHVYAFEPNPAMVWLLRKWTPSNVSVVPRALSDRAGEALLRIPRLSGRCSNNIGTLRVTNTEPDCETIHVPMSRLDDEALSDVGFIKIDVEGLEQEVLRGASSLIQRDRPVLLVEIVPEHTGRAVGETIGLVESWGYRTLVVHRGRLTDWAVARDERERMQEAGNQPPRLRNYVFLPQGPRRVG